LREQKPSDRNSQGSACRDPKGERRRGHGNKKESGKPNPVTLNSDDKDGTLGTPTRANMDD